MAFLEGFRARRAAVADARRAADNGPVLSRRNLLRGAGLVGVAGLAAACSNESSLPVGTVAPDGKSYWNGKEYVPFPGGATTGSAAGGATTGTQEGSRPTDVPHLADVATLNGIPSYVDASRVDTVKGIFTNTIHNGTEGWLAEPGHLPSRNQVFETPPPYSAFDLSEGGFMLASAGYMTVDFGNGVNVDLKGKEGRNWFLVVRGRNSDRAQDTDLNMTPKFTKYKEGHIMAMAYTDGDGGFISEKQFKQIAGTSHTGQTNCGADGCSELLAMFYDVNTGAVTVARQVVGQGQSTDAAWQTVYRNW